MSQERHFPGYPVLTTTSKTIEVIPLFQYILKERQKKGHPNLSANSVREFNDPKYANDLEVLADSCIDYFVARDKECLENKENKNYEISFDKNLNRVTRLSNIVKKLREKLAQAQNQSKFSNITVTVSDKIEERYEKIHAFQFVSANSSINQVLEEWKKSLHGLMDKAIGNDEKLKIVDEYIAETEKVVQAFNKVVGLGKQDAEVSDIASAELMQALESFQNKILKISEDEAVLRNAINFIGILAITVVIMSIVIGSVIAISLSAPLFLTLLSMILCPSLAGGAIASSCLVFNIADNAIGYDAVYPPKTGEKKTFIAEKLTEFGIFGNNPKHKARYLLDAVREDAGIKSVEANEAQAKTHVLPEPPVLMPVYRELKFEQFTF